MEIWKKIEGYTNYKVSNYGEVKSLNFGRMGKERILKKEISPNKYYRVMLYEKTKGKRIFIHRLVALAFIKNRENKTQVNHKNGIKIDNRVDNLEWCTASENQRHAVKNGLLKGRKGSTNSNSKINEKDVLEIRSSKKSQKELSEEYGISIGSISQILNNKAWNHI